MQINVRSQTILKKSFLLNLPFASLKFNLNKKTTFAHFNLLHENKYAHRYHYSFIDSL